MAGPSEAERRALEFAELYLHAGANGLPCAELAKAMADAVLAGTDTELARQILAGGKHAHGAAAQLASPISTDFSQLLRSFLTSCILLLTVGCAIEDDDSVETRSHSQASTASSTTFKLELPEGVAMSQVGLATTSALNVADRVKVLTGSSATGYGSVVNTGAGTLEAGTDTKLGGVFSGGKVFLRDRAHVFGDVWAGGKIEKQNQVAVDGVQIQYTPLSLRTVAEYEFALPAPGQDVTLEPDRTQVLEPGSYGRLHIKSRSRVLLLSGGQYYFKSLFLEPDSTLYAENSNGPVFVVVSGEVNWGSGFTFRGAIEKADDSPNLLFAYLGTSEAYIERAFTGTLLAPNATVRLQVSPVTHRGAFYAKTLVVQPDTTIQTEPFDPGDCKDNSFACEVGLGCLDADASGELDCRECTAGAGPACDAADVPSSAARALSGQILLPKGVGLRHFTVGARTSLTVGSGAKVSDPNDTERLLTVAEGNGTLESGADTVGVVATDGATLLDSSRVRGDVLSTGPSSVSSNVVVEGQVLSGQPLQPPDVHDVSATFGSRHQGDRLIGPGGDRILWPGHYGSVQVTSGATAYFKSGEYRFESLQVESNSHVRVSSESGPVRVYVADDLLLEGSVRPFSDEAPNLIITYFGDSAVSIADSFHRTLLAPNTSIDVRGGTHSATIYGAAVELADGAEVEASTTNGIAELIPDTSAPPDETIDRVGESGGLSASTDAPGEVVSNTSFPFSIPARIPTQGGNAGNYPAVLEIETGGGATITCDYQGGAPVPHPTTLLELAQGREYLFVSCDDGSSSGDVVQANRVHLELDGDPQALGGVTKTTLPVADSCDGYHPDAISPGESQQMIQAFSWPAPDPSTGNLPLLEDRTQDGRPALYYATVYVKSQADLDFIDRTLMHRLDKPLFSNEWPDEWTRECGIIPFEHDGEGQWIFVVLPGVIYNMLLEAQHRTDVAQEAKDMIPPVLLRDIPASVRTQEGSLDLDVLGDSGFRYLNQRELPSKEAVLNAALGSAGPGAYPSGIVALIGDIIEWVVNAVYDVVREVVVLMGTLQGVFSGTTEISVDVQVLNTDPRFEPLMRRAWGRLLATPQQGGLLAPEGAQVRLHMITQNFFTGFIPVPSHFRGYLDENGISVLNVAKRDWAAPSDFQSICVTYANDAAKLTGFLIPSQICDGSFSDADFGHFQQPSAKVEMNLKSRHLSAFTEMTDSHRYMREVVGDAPRQAYVTIGTTAYHLSGFQEQAWAPCLGYGDLAADAVFFAALGTQMAVPLLGALSSAYVAVLAQSDIVLTDSSAAPGMASFDVRGLGTHEYGHFVACHLARRYGWGELDDLVLTLETVLAGQGTPDPNEEARLVNEALADFFAGQVANASDYYPFNGGAPKPGVSSGTRGETSVLAPGLDDNQFLATTGRQAIGRLATLLQDVYDGQANGVLGPTNGDAWAGTPPSIPISYSVRADGDTDLENVALGGSDIGRFYYQMPNNFVIDLYRVENVEKAAARLLTERTNWCQKCILMAPHFTDLSGATVRQHIDTCLTDPVVSDRVGTPPLEIRRRDAATCSLCPLGQGMGDNGGCVECPVDMTYVWGVDGGGTCSHVDLAQADVAPSPTDFCPDTFVVELDNTTAMDPALTANVGADPELEGFECTLTHVSGTTQIGGAAPTSFGSWGEDQYSSGSDISLGCGWLDPTMQLSVAGQSVRYRVDSRIGGLVPSPNAVISLTNIPETCGVVK